MQSPNDRNTLIVQSSHRNIWRRIRRYTSTIIVKHAILSGIDAIITIHAESGSDLDIL